MSRTDDLVEAGFGPVADAFYRFITDDREAGASLSVWMDGVPVVELASGTADHRTGRPFSRNTLSQVFSCSKGLASVLVAKLIDDGRLPGLDTPIAEVWPQFALHGKGRASIGDLLAHRGGVSAPRAELTRDDVMDELRVADLLAAQEPLWLVPEHHQYHPVTFGSIVAKLVMIATGRPLAEVFAEEVAAPLAADTWFGLPQTEFDRVAFLVLPDAPADTPNDDPATAYWLERAVTMTGALPPDDVYNQPDVWGTQLSGMGAVSSASGLARIWSAAVVETNGTRLLSPEAVENLRRPRSVGEPYFSDGSGVYQSWGAGVMVPSPWDPYLSAASFGHDGAGGHVSFADSDARLGFGYITNRFGDWARGISITNAIKKVVGAV